MVGYVFTVCIRTETQNQASFSLFGLVHMEIFVLIELTIALLSGILAHTLADLEAEGRLESHGAIVVAVVVHQVVLLILQGVLRV